MLGSFAIVSITDPRNDRFWPIARGRSIEQRSFEGAYRPAVRCRMHSGHT